MRRHCTISLILAALLVLAVGPAAAANGRIPIYEVPLTIDQPGSYYLTRDIAHNGAGVAITIAASDVTIDFMGHTLDFNGAGTYAISSDGSFTNITIRNGTLLEGNIGIRLRNVTGSKFTTRIEDMTIRDTLNQGIYVEGTNTLGHAQSVVRDTVVENAGGHGIAFRYVWGGRIEGNLVTRAGANGIYLSNSRSVAVEHNTVSSSMQDGARLYYSYHCAVDWNVLAYNDEYGLEVFNGSGNVVSHNRASGNTLGAFSIDVNNVDMGGNWPAP